MNARDTTVQRVLELLTRTLGDVADALGASYDATRSWRQGRRSPSAKHLERLADLAEEHGGELRDLASDLRDAAHRKRGS